MHSREIQVYIEVEDPNRLRVLIPGVVHARGAIDKLAIALRDSCRHRRVLFSSKVEPPQEIVEKSCAKLRAIIPPIGKALLGLLGDDVVETLVEYSEGRLMQMAERKLRHYIDSFLSKQQTNPENAPAFVYSSSQLSKGLLETLKTPDGADKAWEVLSRLMSDKHPEVPLKFLLHVKAAIVRSSRAHGLLKRLQHIADELLPPMFGGTLTEIARKSENLAHVTRAYQKERLLGWSTIHDRLHPPTIHLFFVIQALSREFVPGMGVELETVMVFSLESDILAGSSTSN